MIAMKKSSLMAAMHMMHSIEKRKTINERVKDGSLVKVSGLGMQRPTIVGSAVKHFRSDSHVFVGAEEVKQTSPLASKSEETVVHETPPSEARQIAHIVKDNLGETAGKFVLGSMVVGPPIIGGMLWGATGLMVGSVIASPFVLVFVWSIIK